MAVYPAWGIALETRSGAAVNGAEAAAGYHRLQKAGEARLTWGRQFDSGMDVLVSASGYRARGQNLFLDYGATGMSGLAAGMDGERGGKVRRLGKGSQGVAKGDASVIAGTYASLSACAEPQHRLADVRHFLAVGGRSIPR
mgnify:CR=1 FL=1